METTATKMIVRHLNTNNTDWKNDISALYSNPLFIEKALNYPHAHFAAFNGKEIVGHALIQYIGSKWILGALIVKPEFREQGIGKNLTRVRIDFAKKLGIKKLWYESKNDNLVSICCHIGVGFKKICPQGQTHCNPATAHWYTLETSTAIACELN